MNNEFINLARQSFLAYCHIIDPLFKHNWHHVKMCKVLEKIARGESKRVIFSLPPQHGKTYFVTQRFPTFYFGRNPKSNIISTSYSQQYAEDSGTFVKSMMLTDEYKKIFNIQITQSTKSKKRFSLVNGGNYYAVGRGGTITGRGAQLIIIDDLIKNNHEAMSKKYRDAMIDWYKNTLRTRLRKNGSIIIIQTRWHQNDLIGYLLKDSSEDWENIVFPAISEKNEALWHELYELEHLEAIRKEMGSLAFEGLYQQKPALQDGFYIKDDWIQRYDILPKVIEDSIITFDLTFKGDEQSDWVVGQYWVKSANNFFLIDMIRGKWDFTKQLFHMKQFIANHINCGNIVIEDSANASAIFSVIKQNVSGIKLWKPKTSKESRLQSVAPLFEAKNIYIPKEQKYDDLVTELLGFPNMEHDDTVDACTMALLNLRKQSLGMVMSLGERIF